MIYPTRSLLLCADCRRTLQAREGQLQESWRLITDQARQAAVVGGRGRAGIPLCMLDERDAAAAAQGMLTGPNLGVELSSAGAAGSPEVSVTSDLRRPLVRKPGRVPSVQPGAALARPMQACSELTLVVKGDYRR